VNAPHVISRLELNLLLNVSRRSNTDTEHLQAYQQHKCSITSCRPPLRQNDIPDLLAAGPDSHTRDGCGNTALHHLAIGLVDKFTDEQRRLFRLFLDRGVDVNLRNKDGWTAVSIFLDSECPITKKQHGNISDQLDNEVLGWFEGAGTDWNVKDPKGRTLLHIVAGHHNSRTVERAKFLLRKGVSAVEEDGEKRTAWDVAAASGNDELPKLRDEE